MIIQIDELIDLTRWKKKNQILMELKQQGFNCKERTFRKWVEDFNKRYDGTNDYIVHGNKGYKMTRDIDEIKQSVTNNDRRAFTMLKQTYMVRKHLGLETQYKLFEETAND